MKHPLRYMLALAPAASAVVIAGCAPDRPVEPPQANRRQLRANLFPSGRQLMTVEDAVPSQEYLIQLIAYKITVPIGSVSRNEEFWKHVDEHAVDVPTYELLFKNGMRVGVAAAAEWSYLKELLKENPAITQPSSFTGRDAKDIDLEMKMRVPYQNLFYYDTHGDLTGRTYERCDNLLRMSFQPAPRKPGTVRLGMCPVIRSLRERIQAVGDVNTRSYRFIHPEQLYELNLTVDIPFDGFLVVAPSEEGKWPTSLGSTFLVNDDAAAQTETLLIFKAMTYRERPSKAPATQP